MQEMIIEKIPRGGYRIKVYDFKMKYYGYTLKQAEKEFRKQFGFVGTRFNKIYL